MGGIWEGICWGQLEAGGDGFLGIHIDRCISDSQLDNKSLTNTELEINQHSGIPFLQFSSTSKNLIEFSISGVTDHANQPVSFKYKV